MAKTSLNKISISNIFTKFSILLLVAFFYTNVASADFVDDLIADMGDNEATLMNAPNTDWAKAAIGDMGAAPRGDAAPRQWVQAQGGTFTSSAPWLGILPWFQIWPEEGNSGVSTVEISNIQVQILEKSTNKWRFLDLKPNQWGQLEPWNLIGGKGGVDQSQVGEGVYSYVIDNSGPVHGGLGRHSLSDLGVDPSNIAGVVISAGAQITQGGGNILFSIGGDYYPNMEVQVSDYALQWGPAIGGSRFGKIGSEMRCFYITTIDPPGQGDPSNYYNSGGKMFLTEAELRANPPQPGCNGTGANVDNRPKLTFTAEEKPGRGNDVILKWETERANTCTASDGTKSWTGDVGTSGTKTITDATESTRFSLTCEGDEFRVKKTVKISAAGEVLEEDVDESGSQSGGSQASDSSNSSSGNNQTTSKSDSSTGDNKTTNGGIDPGFNSSSKEGVLGILNLLLEKLLQLLDLYQALLGFGSTSSDFGDIFNSGNSNSSTSGSSQSGAGNQSTGGSNASGSGSGGSSSTGSGEASGNVGSTGSGSADGSASAGFVTLPESTLSNKNVNCSDTKARCVGVGEEYSTIQTAVNAAGANDTVYVRAGTYPEEVTISKSNLKLVAYPGEEKQALITGAQPINSWSKANSSELNGNSNASKIYSANTTCDVQRVFQNGNELTASRYPSNTQTGEDRYLHISSVDSSNPRKIFTSSEISRSSDYFTGSRLHVRTVPWQIYSRRVSSQTSGGKVTLSDEIRTYNMEPQQGFFFTQVVGEISKNGEWAYKNGKLYLMSNGTPSNVEVSCRDYGVRVAANVENVTIDNLVIEKTRHDAIKTDNENKNITITNNKILSCGDAGINVYEENTHGKGGPAIIKNNEIRGCGLFGIQVRSQVVPATIENNFIHEIGAKKYNDDFLHDGDYAEGSGVFIINSPGTVITKNRIDKVAYSGVFLVDFGDLNGGNRTISYNHITDAMLGINDGGGIYFDVYEGTSATKDIVQNNIVEDSIGGYLGTTQASGYYPQGAGIYLDNGSSYIDVKNNTLVRSTHNLFLHDSKNSQIWDNTIYESNHNNLFLTNSANDCNDSKRVSTNNSLLRNISFKTKNTVPLLLLQKGYSDCSILSEASGNIFHSSANKDYVTEVQYRPSNSVSKVTLNSWKASSGFTNNTEAPTCTAPKLITNPTMNNANYSGLNNCKDINGGSISSLSIKPFGSRILCGCSGAPSLSLESTPTAQVAGVSINNTGSTGVAKVSAEILRVRFTPSLSAPILGNVTQGMVGVVNEGPVEIEGYNWYNINYADGLTGWSSEKGLEVKY